MRRQRLVTVLPRQRSITWMSSSVRILEIISLSLSQRCDMSMKHVRFDVWFMCFRLFTELRQRRRQIRRKRMMKTKLTNSTSMRWVIEYDKIFYDSEVHTLNDWINKTWKLSCKHVSKIEFPRNFSLRRLIWFMIE